MKPSTLPFTSWKVFADLLVKSLLNGPDLNPLLNVATQSVGASFSKGMQIPANLATYYRKVSFSSWSMPMRVSSVSFFVLQAENCDKNLQERYVKFVI